MNKLGLRLWLSRRAERTSSFKTHWQTVREVRREIRHNTLDLAKRGKGNRAWARVKALSDAAGTFTLEDLMRGCI